MIDSELAQLTDQRVVTYIQALRNQPIVSMRRWDYGQKGERYPCWTVLSHSASNTGIAYCGHGFGPRSPWGLVFLGDEEGSTSMGMESSWYPTFLQAFFESHAASDLPIWRVFKTDRITRERQAISNEGDWDATWARVMALRETDPVHQYDCSTCTLHELE